jgi:hypothetical protein
VRRWCGEMRRRREEGEKKMRRRRDEGENDRKK